MTQRSIRPIASSSERRKTMCQESNAAVNPKTNLGRCFRCKRNFNPIDFVIEVQASDFRTAIGYLLPLLPPPRHASEA